MNDVVELAASEDLLRRCAPQVLGALVRSGGDFVSCEDAVQDALLAAVSAWPHCGVPDDPVGWLATVARRKLIDRDRAEKARRRREDLAAARDPNRGTAPPADTVPSGDLPAVSDAADDTLQLLMLCAHPALSEASRIALILRAVGGLRTPEIARALLVPETTVAQRISRAKATIAAAGGAFDLADDHHDERLTAALHVLYLVFDEGYTATSGPLLTRVDLTSHAVRLTRRLHELLPHDGEIAGLLALMLLTDARRDTRVDDTGVLVPLAEQDRARWDHRTIEEAVALLTGALRTAPLGPYQLQAAIAAVHVEAASDEETDWNQIVVLYGLLERRTDNPVVTLNRAVAVGMARGAESGLRLLDSVADDPRLRRSHRPDAVRAHLLERLGDTVAAREHYRRAARAATNQAEQRYLEKRSRAE